MAAVASMNTFEALYQINEALRVGDQEKAKDLTWAAIEAYHRMESRINHLIRVAEQYQMSYSQLLLLFATYQWEQLLSSFPMHPMQT